MKNSTQRTGTKPKTPTLADRPLRFPDRPIPVLLSLDKAMKLRLLLETATQDAQRLGLVAMDLILERDSFRVRLRSESLEALRDRKARAAK